MAEDSSWLDTLLERLSPTKRAPGAESAVRHAEEAEGGDEAPNAGAGKASGGAAAEDDASPAEGSSTVAAGAGDEANVGKVGGDGPDVKRTSSIDELAAKLAKQAEDFRREVRSLAESLIGRERMPPTPPPPASPSGDSSSSPGAVESSRTAVRDSPANAGVDSATSPGVGGRKNAAATPPAAAAGDAPFSPRIPSAQEAREGISRAMSSVSSTINGIMSSLVDRVMDTVAGAAELVGLRHGTGKYRLSEARAAAKDVMRDMVRVATSGPRAKPEYASRKAAKAVLREMVAVASKEAAAAALAGKGEEGGGEVVPIAAILGGVNGASDAPAPYIDLLCAPEGGDVGQACWVPAGDLSCDRGSPGVAAPVGKDNVVLVCGGIDDKGMHLATTELVELSGAEGGRREQGPAMKFKRSGAGVAMLGGAGGGGCYVIGGFDGKESVKFMEVLEAGPGGWGSCTGGWKEVHMMRDARYKPMAISVSRKANCLPSEHYSRCRLFENILVLACRPPVMFADGIRGVKVCAAALSLSCF